MTKKLIEEFLQTRYVIFNTVAGVSVMAVILEELDDSFIVGLPARLVKERGTISAEPYLLESVVARFYKQTLLNHVPLSDAFEIPYLHYLVDNGHRINLPEEEIEAIKGELTSISLEEEDPEIVELPSHVKFVFPETKEVH